MTDNNNYRPFVKDLSSKSLFKLRTSINTELRNRVNARIQHEQDLADTWAGFSNFMYGVAVAMACRQVLRWSRGHSPTGVIPMHGACWTASEIGEAYRIGVRYLENRNKNVLTHPFNFKNKRFDPNFERLWYTQEGVNERWKSYYSEIPF